MLSNIKARNCIMWEEFLSQHELSFPEVSYKGGYYSENDRVHGLRRKYKKEWEEGLFIGNGMIGAMIYKDSRKSLKWELGRNDVVAHNFLHGIDWAVPRVPIGDFLLTPSGNVTSESMKLSLWNAEAEGVINTDRGAIEWHSLAHAVEDIIIIKVKTSGEEKNISLGFRPEHGVSHRILYADKKPTLDSLPQKPFQTVIDGMNVSIQTFIKEDENDTFVDEGECAVAWKEIKESDNELVVYISITNSYYDDTARNKAVQNIKSSIQLGLSECVNTHREWWHNYYPRSYVSFSDKKWEKFYWIQMYKIACAMKEDGVVLDSQGPWLTVTPWPTTVWNLNVQLCYMPLYTSNRVRLGNSLINTLKKNEKILIENAKPLGIDNGMYISRATNPIDLTAPWPDTRELGNLTWALHNIWRHYRVSMDEALLREFLYPFLKANINSYLCLMYKGEDGKYHIRDTSSPEYPSAPNTNHFPINDCNYTLALLRWGCQTLLEINEKLGLNDELRVQWEDVISNLVNYPTDENGFMVGEQIPFAVSHRHYSHLFMIYPLHLLDKEEPKVFELMKKSIGHWVGFVGALQGYTYTGAAAMEAYLGNGNKALEYLNGLEQYLCPNTMYSEKGPVIETPLSATESIHYMLMQSWGDVIRVFPAVPDDWQEVEFRDLLAEGAFEVSAARKAGKTQYVKIKSLAGSSLRIQPNIDGRVKCLINDNEMSMIEVEKGIYEIELKKGESVTLLSEVN